VLACFAAVVQGLLHRTALLTCIAFAVAVVLSSVRQLDAAISASRWLLSYCVLCCACRARSATSWLSQADIC